VLKLPAMLKDQSCEWLTFPTSKTFSKNKLSSTNGCYFTTWGYNFKLLWDKLKDIWIDTLSTMLETSTINHDVDFPSMLELSTTPFYKYQNYNLTKIIDKNIFLVMLQLKT
jgi:hypothetical protein